MFIASLEYRKYCRRRVTDADKAAYLGDLAVRVKTSGRDSRPVREIAAEILADYEAGADILDPDLFEREDIVRFAEANGITSDPMVVDFIARARTRAEWAEI